MDKETTPKGKKRKNLQKEISEIEANNLSGIEFKELVTRMLKTLSEKCKKLSGTYISMKKDLETSNKNQIEKKSAIPEIKNTQ